MLVVTITVVVPVERSEKGQVLFLAEDVFSGIGGVVEDVSELRELGITVEEFPDRLRLSIRGGGRGRMGQRGKDGREGGGEFGAETEEARGDGRRVEGKLLVSRVDCGSSLC